jgi:hypothetical protein
VNVPVESGPNVVLDEVFEQVLEVVYKSMLDVHFEVVNTGLVLLVVLDVVLEVVSVVPVTPMVDEVAVTATDLELRPEVICEVTPPASISSNVSTITCALIVFVMNEEIIISMPGKRMRRMRTEPHGLGGISISKLVGKGLPIVNWIWPSI